MTDVQFTLTLITDIVMYKIETKLHESDVMTIQKGDTITLETGQWKVDHIPKETLQNISLLKLEVKHDGQVIKEVDTVCHVKVEESML